MAAQDLAYIAEFFARLVVTSLCIVTLALAGYCSSLGEDYVATFVVISIIFIYSVAMTVRAWILFRQPVGSRNVSSAELGCYGALDWIMMAACTPSIIFMAMADYGGRRWVTDEKTGISDYEPYVTDPWRNYGIYIQSAIVAIQFMLGIGVCVCCCTTRTKTKRIKRELEMQRLQQRSQETDLTKA